MDIDERTPKQRVKDKLMEMKSDMHKQKLERDVTLKEIDGVFQARFSINGVIDKNAGHVYKNWSKVFNKLEDFEDYAKTFFATDTEKLRTIIKKEQTPSNKVEAS